MRLSTRMMVEIGLLVSLAVVLDFIRLFQAPFGGSVTLGSMVPIFLVAFRFGGRAGFIAGALFGTMQLFFGAYIFTPFQVILDYVLAYAVIGVAGFFVNRPVIGVLVGSFSRFVVHFLSGIIFWYMYTPEGMQVWMYSLVYNGSYMIFETLIAVVVIAFLPKRLLRV